MSAHHVINEVAHFSGMLKIDDLNIGFNRDYRFELF
jgi:hypothetical protein